jgi:RNA polymerase sigma-70 factor (sigma-E family)
VRAEFTTFYEREAPGLVRSVTLVTGDAALAEDAVAEAFARAWSRWARVRQHPKPVAWVATVALNESRSRFRRRKVERRKAQLIARPDTIHDPDPPRVSSVWAAVAGLSQQDRTLIALRYVADLSQDEIAGALGMPLGSVASGLSRARHRLGVVLRQEHEEELT